MPRLSDEPPAALAQDESYWRRVRRLFDLPPDVLNLDNGNISPASREAIEAAVQASRKAQPFPVKRFEDLADTAQAVARIRRTAPGRQPDRIGVRSERPRRWTRCCSDTRVSLATEIVCSAHDYYAMRDAIEHGASATA